MQDKRARTAQPVCSSSVPKDAQPHRLLCDQRGFGGVAPNKHFQFSGIEELGNGHRGPTMHCLLFLLESISLIAGSL